MKGQVKLEFIFGVVMFAIVILWVVSQINTVYAGIGSDSRNDALRAKAYNIMSYLAEGSGETNWESSVSPKFIGLAYDNQPYNLSENKIDALNTNCSLLDGYNLGAYRITIQDNTGELLFCGSRSVAQIRIMITRSVWIEDRYGNMTVEVW